MESTYGQALALVGVTVPDHLEADALVPILNGVQAQGDLLVHPVDLADDIPWLLLPADGIQVVHGEATGNTHWLHRGFESPGVAWAPGPNGVGLDDLTLGYLRVPSGQTALLIHTDEHGANGIGPGTYAVHRKREVHLDDAMDRLVED